MNLICFNGRFPPESFMKVSIFRNPILNYGQVHARRNDFNIGFIKSERGHIKYTKRRAIHCPFSTFNLGA